MASVYRPPGSRLNERVASEMKVGEVRSDNGKSRSI